MKKIDPAVIPSFFTSANILFGYLSIYYSFLRDFDNSAWMLLMATVCDILDGRLARGLNAMTKFGAELDSLADAISFGVAPAVLMLHKNLIGMELAGVILSFVYVLCGVFRLARFNITPSSKPHFEGLPIPGGAGCIATFTLLEMKYEWGPFSPQFYVGFLLFLSFLMISTIPFFSLKKNTANATVRLYFGYGLMVILLTQFPAEILFLMGYSYVFYGIGMAGWNLLNRLRGRPRPPEDMVVDNGEERPAAGKNDSQGL